MRRAKELANHSKLLQSGKVNIKEYFLLGREPWSSGYG